MNDYSKTAISLVSLKETALYFDYVIPINLGVALILSMGPERLRHEENPFGDLEQFWPPGLTGQLVPPHLRANRVFKERLPQVNEATLHWSLKGLVKRYGLPPRIAGVSDEQYQQIERRVNDEFNAFIEDFDLHTCPLDASSMTLSDETPSDSVIMAIASLELIDAQTVGWSQILEFRKSSEARDKLRRLRLFAFENYAGRSRAFIEDDLHQRLSDYHDALKEWGFETRQGTISALLHSKLMGSALTGSLVSALFG